MISLSKVFFTNVNIRLIVSTPSSKGSWRKPASYAWQRGKLSIETSIHCESGLNFNFVLLPFMFPPLACKVSIKKKIFSDSFQNPLLTSDPGRCFWVSMFYSYFICFRFFRINLEIFYIVCFSLYLNQYSCLSLLGLFQLFICNTNIHWHCIDWESTHLVDLGQSFVNA